MKEVKQSRRRGHTRVSRKHQATIPVDALHKAGLRAGDELRVEAAGPGRIVLVRADNLIAHYAGSLPGVYPAGYLGELRDEWR
jgi:bifunctional DNA-binding transcriptional regulator/antitoxin component of YhaV-PrlF toxin-antitoxin module